MITIRWFFRMITDTILFGFANGSLIMSLSVITFLFLGLLIIAANVSAPFIYTLF